MLLAPSIQRDDLVVAPISRPTTVTPTPSTMTTTISTREERAEFDALLAAVVPCRTEDPELWFAERTADVERAKALCRDCPLAVGCLAGAVERNEPWGVWGGEVFVDGQVVAMKRGRGRPRKVRPEDAQVA
ncbi:WhiB family transcriptional regulator [Sanguibacter sp. HDW7]|nr:WhiB family transcriptional regulator [Sanguibacter sp. HDW7]